MLEELKSHVSNGIGEYIDQYKLTKQYFLDGYNGFSYNSRLLFDIDFHFGSRFCREFENQVRAKEAAFILGNHDSVPEHLTSENQYLEFIQQLKVSSVPESEENHASKMVDDYLTALVKDYISLFYVRDI